MNRILRRAVILSAGLASVNRKGCRLRALTLSTPISSKQGSEEALQNLLQSADKTKNKNEQCRLLSEAADIGEVLDLPLGHMGRLYDMAGNAHYQAENFSRAEKYFMLSINRWVNAGVPPESPPIIETSLKMSHIYRMQNELAKASSGYKWCADTAKKYLETDNSDNMKSLYGIALDSYGRFLYEVGKYKEALPVIKESIVIAKEIDSDGERIATLKINYSSVLAEVGEYQQSVNVLNEIIALPKIARLRVTAMINKALLYGVKMENPEKAKLLLRQAVKAALELNDEELVHYVRNIAKENHITL